MNPDNPQSPRDELQARVTALLLGELSDEEAAALRHNIEQDADLARLYERLKQTIDLAREATTNPTEQTAAQPAPLHLSDERRQKLLAHFKTVAPTEFVQTRRRGVPWFVPMGAAAVLVATIGATLLVPQSVSRRELSRLYSIEDGFVQAAGSDYLKAGQVKLAAGDTYAFDAAGEPATMTPPVTIVTGSGAADDKQRGERLPSVNIVPAKLVDQLLSAELRGFYDADGEKNALATPTPTTEENLAVAKLPVGSKGGPSRQAQTQIPETGNIAATRRREIILPSSADPAGSASQVSGGGLAGGGGFGGGAPDQSGFDVGRSYAVNGGFEGRGDALAWREPSPAPAQPSREAKTPAAAVPPPARLAETIERSSEALGLERSERERNGRIGVQGGTAPFFAEGAPTATPVPAKPTAETAVARKESEQITALARISDATAGARSENLPALGDTLALGTQPQTDAAPANTAYYYSRQMMERYALLPNAPPPSAAGETTTVPTEYGLTPTSVPQTGGKDFSKWAAGQSGAAVTNWMAYDFNWELDQSAARGREAAGTSAYRVDAGGYVNLPTQPSNLATVAAEEAVRKKSDAIALPPSDPDLSGRTISDLEPRQADVLTDSKSTLDGLNRELGRRNEEVAQAQATVDELRQKLKTSDTAPAATLGPETERRLEAERANAAKTHAGLEMLIEEKEKAAKAQIESLDASVKNARDKDAAMPEANQPYFRAKRELENLEKVRDAVQLRILQEAVDASLPKTGIVEILDLAEAQPAKSPTLWQRIGGALTGEVERSARISIEKDTSDIMPLMGTPSSGQYDPYFMQTESEKIQSKAVLNKVIEKLNLSEAWADKHGSGGKLKTEETLQLLSKKLDIRTVPKTSLIEINVKSDQPEEAASIANTIAEVYRESRMDRRKEIAVAGTKALEKKLVEQNKEIARAEEELQRVKRESKIEQADEDRPVVPRKPAPNAPIPQPEIHTHDNAWSTFSLNVSDVSFKLAAASLEKGAMPEPATVRSEEFINAFDYRDPEPPPGVPIAFAWERARYPFAHNRDLLRFSVKTAAAGRQPGRPLNLVLLLDNSGSMERADRARIIHEALRVLATQLQPQDKISVITFARTARLWVDGVPGNQAAEVADQVGRLTPQGGTNFEEGMKAAYQTALRHYLANGVNRVVLLTDGAANLGNVDPESLKQKVEAHRKQGIALDCFGIGWEGFNDDLLEVLSRNGDGRYGFINTAEEAATEFAGQLAGALRVAASDVKVQVEFNPARVTAYRQIGYAKHQLTKEQFRDNTVDAAEIGAAESGNALYVAEVNPRGEGPLAIVRVRFKIPGTSDYREHEWAVPFTGNAVSLEQASPMMRLAATASAFSEWLVSSPYAAEVTPDQLLGYLGGVPEICGADARPKKLEWMIRQAKSIAGK